MWKRVTQEWVDSFGPWDMPTFRVKDANGNEYDAENGWIEEHWDGYDVGWHDGDYNSVEEPEWYWDAKA